MDKIIGGIIIGSIVVFLVLGFGGWALSGLWNLAIVPFGLPEMSFWQGIGIYILIQVIFGRLRISNKGTE